ncbi:pyruvate formate lyase family protein [Chloroflexota bacterium]
MVIETKEEVLLGQIDQLELSDRLRRWKEASLDAKPRICTERAELAMEAWKESAKDDIETRRAKLLKHILENIPVHIHPWQLLAGSESEHIYGGHPDVDLSSDSILRVMGKDNVSVGSPVVGGEISAEGREKLIECALFFKGQTVCEHVIKAWDSALGTRHTEFLTVLGLMGTPGPYIRAPITFERVLSKGMRGIIEEAQANISRFTEGQETDVEKLYFWQAVIIVCEALVNYARRHAELARALASKETDPERRRELEEIAEVCHWVPENPARTLHEAIQCITFVLLAVKMETPHMPGDDGRPDQYLWPYFEKDLREDRVTLEKAAELIGDFIAFRGSVVSVMEMRYVQSQQTVAELNHVTVGGVDRKGEDATNPLSYLILHVLGLLGIPEPHCSLRWHPDTPPWIMRKALETTAKISGTPQFVNDAHVEEFWTQRGVPLEEIRDWSGLGCLPPMPQNCAYQLTGVMNQAKILELVLHNGVDPLTGKQLGPETGDPRTFATFNDLLEAFKRQYEFWCHRLTWMGRLAWAEEPRYVRLPFFSSILDGCVERGRDIVCKDTPYYFTFCDDRSVIDNADCLMAIKKLVFDEKKLTMDELMAALDSDFTGERGEEIRHMCLAAPKYGNDIDEVDYLARHLGDFGGKVIGSDKTPDGRPFSVERPGVAWHYMAGKMVGALPNGRKAWEPLNDATLSPMRGQDKYGPTAVLRSVFKAGLKESLYNVLNQKFSLTAVQTPESMKKLGDLTETYLRNGGLHIQYNLVDTQTLRDAQVHPEMHKDLVVRVGGFSAYFIQLTREVQDDIIARTEQGL